MGIEGLYTIRALGGGNESVEGRGVEAGRSAVFGVTLDASHRIFAGHFPEMPVLPGVCTMHIVKSCASLLAGRQLRYAAVGEVKFLAPVNPSVNPVLEIRIELGEPDTEGARSLRAEALNGGNIVLKIKSTVVAEI